MDRILVTGAKGQIGSALVAKLRSIYGTDNVISTDIRNLGDEEDGIFEKLNIMDKDDLAEIVDKYKINIVYHLAALLSATGEKDPFLCWDINMNGTLNVLEIGVDKGFDKIFIPSSIAVWGEGVPLVNTPQDTPLYPATMYGVTKVAGEALCDYFVKKYNLDCRGIRYPGIISSETMPGGGTTDYAVDIYHSALKSKHYNCFLKEDAALPMMYMPDCINATLQLMNADFDTLRRHSNYNVTAMSFTPSEIYAEIKKHLPDFEIEYNPDFRQKIAESWPQSIDDSFAREDWGWKPEFDLETMTKDMLEKLAPMYSK